MPEAAHHTGRIEWQRSEARFLYSELASVVFPRLIDSLDEYTFKAGYEKIGTIMGMPQEPWYTPVLAAEVMANIDYATPDYQAVIQAGSKPASLRLHDRYTYWRDPNKVFREAFVTAAHFPVSVAHELDIAHASFYDGRHLVRHKTDVVRILKTGEFSDILHDMALAPNGYWPAVMSDNSQTVVSQFWSRDHHPCLQSLFQKSDSALGVSLDQSAQLRALRHNNHVSLDPPMKEESRYAERSSQLSKASSSGCPVAEEEASFTTPRTRQYRGRLLRNFGISRQQIETPREKTGIQLGLEAYIEVLEKTIAYYSKELMGQNELANTGS